MLAIVIIALPILGLLFPKNPTWKLSNFMKFLFESLIVQTKLGVKKAKLKVVKKRMTVLKICLNMKMPLQLAFEKIWNYR